VDAVRPAEAIRGRKCNACGHKKEQPFATLFGPSGQDCVGLCDKPCAQDPLLDRSFKTLNESCQGFDVSVAQLGGNGAHDLSLAIIGALSIAKGRELFFDVRGMLAA
jgi:hypothetical protein